MYKYKHRRTVQQTKKLESSFGFGTLCRGGRGGGCDTYMLQGAYSTRWAIVMKGWLSASPGVILLSWSSVSILFNRSMNSFLSTFSAINSLPSRSVGTLIYKTNNTASLLNDDEVLILAHLQCMTKNKFPTHKNYFYDTFLCSLV